jgi:hypothetical protein
MSVFEENYTVHIKNYDGRSRGPRGLRSRSAAARFLGLRVRIPPTDVFLNTAFCVVT